MTDPYELWAEEQVSLMLDEQLEKASGISFDEMLVSEHIQLNEVLKARKRMEETTIISNQMMKGNL